MYKYSRSLSKASSSPKQHEPFYCGNEQSNNHHKTIFSSHPCASSDDTKQCQAFYIRQPILYGIRRSTGSLLSDCADDVCNETRFSTERNDIRFALEIFPNIDPRHIQEFLRHDSIGTIILALASETLEDTTANDSRYRLKCR
jgi:hypothetical protein